MIARSSHADDASRGDELRFAQGQQLAAHDAGHLRPAEEADDRDHGEQARPDDRHEDDHEQQRGDAQDRVGAAHQHLVDAAAEEAGERGRSRVPIAM